MREDPSTALELGRLGGELPGSARVEGEGEGEPLTVTRVPAAFFFRPGRPTERISPEGDSECPRLRESDE